MIMWNWKEFYQLVNQVKRYTRVLYCGESLVQIPQEESMGGPFLLHTVSGIYYGNGAESSFCGYQASQVLAGRLVWLYLRKMPETGQVMFNTVFLRYGGKKQGVQLREKHGIRMIYRKMADNHKQERRYIGKTEFFSMRLEFQKLVIIGSKETEIRKMTVAELLDIFGRAADEKGMLLLVEQNARILCQGMEEKEEIENAISKMM